MRGTWSEPGHGGTSVRFIPARAGNIHRKRLHASRQTVHPRTCGEHLQERHSSWPINGSSPHVRGTFFPFLSPLLLRRFIPARAGNISSPGSLPPPPTVHPRTCGEHLCEHCHGVIRDGSSPHVRGTWPIFLIFSEKFRFIPARAGNIDGDGDNGDIIAVHPRTCGEHFMVPA